MFEYVLRLLILVPLVGGMAWGSLWLWRRSQLGGFGLPSATHAVRIIDAVPVSPGNKLAVVAFSGRQYLLAVSRTQITMIADDAGENRDQA